jgi:hypothetical protein
MVDQVATLVIIQKYAKTDIKDWLYQTATQLLDTKTRSTLASSTSS